MVKTRRIATAGLALCTLFLAGQASAYVTLKYWGGADIYWSKSSIPWYMHPNGSDNVPFDLLQGAVKAGMDAWDLQPCLTKTIAYGGTKTSDPKDGVYIRWKESNWDSSVGDALAYAQTWKNYSGIITNGEIVFNGQMATWSISDSGYFGAAGDVQGILAHEMGHILGLGHTRHREATMYFSGGGIEMRTLEQDDINGLCYIYGGFSNGITCDSCSDNGDCLNGQCKSIGGAKFCRQACTNNAQCGETFVCETSSGLCKPSNGYCDQQGGNIALGQFCYGMETCQTGLCLVLPGDAYCSKECTQNSQCPGMKCSVGYCIYPGTAAIGEPCQMHFECASGTCVGIGSNEGICSQTCNSAQDCPQGLSCANGYCYPGGDTLYGDPCSDNMECQHTKCVSIGSGAKICSAVCTSSSQCPNGDPCVLGYCIPAGEYPHGMNCELDTDCITGYCVTMGTKSFCTMECSDGKPCPNGSTCTSLKYCSALADLTYCLVHSDCPSNSFCKRPGSASYGQCVRSCNPFADIGCYQGQDCAWYWDGADVTVRGECVSYDGGGKEEEDECGIITNRCRPSLLCHSIEDGPFQCYRDCNTSNGLGCVQGEVCLWTGNNNDPLHGVCHCPGECAPPPKPQDVVPQDWGAWKPDTGSDAAMEEFVGRELGLPDGIEQESDLGSDDNSTEGPDSMAADQTGGPDEHDGASGSSNDLGVQKGPSSPSGACAASPGSSPSPAVLAMLMALLVGLMFRICRGKK